MQFRGSQTYIQWVTIIGTTATVVSLVLLYFEFSGRLNVETMATYLWIDTGLCLIMMAEWFMLYHKAVDKRAYVKARWIDLLASLPLLLLLRPLRIVRLLRLLRLLRGIALVHRALRPWEDALDLTLLRSVSLVAVGVVLICSLLIMDLERGNPDLNTFGEALWWAIVTATTVGYGDRYPLTAAGQFVAVILMLLGIGLFGTLAATLTSVMMPKKAKGTTNDDLMARIDSLERRIEQLLAERSDNAQPPSERQRDDTTP